MDDFKHKLTTSVPHHIIFQGILMTKHPSLGKTKWAKCLSKLWLRIFLVIWALNMTTFNLFSVEKQLRTTTTRRSRTTTTSTAILTTYSSSRYFIFRIFTSLVYKALHRNQYWHFSSCLNFCFDECIILIHSYISLCSFCRNFNDIFHSLARTWKANYRFI